MVDFSKAPALEADADQDRAVELLCHGPRVVIITGGPGTGKTTILKRALRHPAMGVQSVVLAAPTGKAAKRMTAVVGQEAVTVHRLLGYNGEGFSPVKLGEDVVIIDEASMLDVELAYALMSALRQTSRLVLIGDVDQIPSVGPGCVLRDLIDSKQVPVVELRTLHRAAADSWVCTNAPRIIAGEEPEYDNRPDFEAHELESSRDALKQVRAIMLANRTTFFQGQFQMLVPMRIGDLGADSMNHLIAGDLNPERMNQDHFEISDSRMDFQSVIGVADRVIQVTNNYQHNIFNGELGTVLSIGGGQVEVQFPDKIVKYSVLEGARCLRLAYVLTIHKAQGSEWDTVAVICHSAHGSMLNRQLLYTAVTRAKKKVILIANGKGIGMALGCNNPRERFTTLPRRLKEWQPSRQHLLPMGQ